jgi:hypothetical protein
MNSANWKALNERFGKAYGSYRNAISTGDVVKNAEKVSEMLVDALKIAGLLYNPKTRKKLRPVYEYKADDQILPFGLAPAVLTQLPDPENFSKEDCANLYFTLVESMSDNRLPGDLFFQAFNYANQLLPQFQETSYFIETEAYEQLEKKLRQRMIRDDFAKLILPKGEAEHPLVTTYRQSLRRVADTYLRHRDYADAVGCLIREIDVKYPEVPKVSDEIEYEKLFWLHYYNQLLGVLPPSMLFKETEYLKSKLTEDQLQRIEDFETSEIDGIEIRDVSSRVMDGSIAPNSSTVIVLAVPAELPKGEYEVGNWKIRVSPLTDPFSDPNFRFVNQQPFVINGMPLAVLSPTLWQTEGVILLEFSTTQPFHPDFEVGEDGQIGDSLEGELRQLYGNDYDPYLAKAIELLREVKSDGWPDRKTLVSALKSADSYFLGFVTPEGAITHHVFKPLTRLNAFLSVKNRFLSRFEKVTGGGHDGDSLKKLLFNDTPMNAEGLLRYVKAVFRELIVRESERGEWWKTVWVEGADFKTVRNEPDVGRDISNAVSQWFKVKGLVFDREVRASGGSIDMLVTGASGGQIHRCGIELKFAHHNNVLSGVSRQLPDYMDDLEADNGIFLTIWCKGKEFPEPSKYGEISELVSELRKNVPENKKIDIIAVNASYRTPPSKRK